MVAATRRIAIAAIVWVLAAAIAACGLGSETVTIATEGGFHPFNFIDEDGEIAGLEREMVDEICRRADMECEWGLNEWSEMIPDLIAGDFDAIVAGMSITAERDAVIDFSDPYYPPTPSVYLALAGAGDDAVKGTLGANKDTIFSDYFAREGVPYTEFDDQADRLQALLSGEIDAILVDHGYAVTKLAEYDGQFEIVGPSLSLDMGLGIGVRTGSQLRARINSALAEMKSDGTLNELIGKWIGPGGSTF